MKHYWLIKSEPDCYSIDNLARDKKTLWTGVRNYQARNFIRSMKKGDEVLFYHSSTIPMGVVGVAVVSGEAEGDLTAIDPHDDHFDLKATKENLIWSAAPISFLKKFKNLVSLDLIKFEPKLKDILVAKRGSRLSIQPVSKAHFEHIIQLGNT